MGITARMAFDRATTVSISGTPVDIHAEAQRLHRALGTPDGGFIGYVEE